MGKAFSNFDIDLKFGQLGEAYVEEVFTGGFKSEVKTDRRWRDTNNIYVETRCWKNATRTWEASGVYAPTLEAEIFTYNLDGMLICVPIESFIYTVENHGRPITCDIEPNPSEGVLLTVSEIARGHREWIRDNDND